MGAEEETRDIDWAIGLAIDEAVKAGVFRRAARLNPQTRMWEAVAAPHSQAVKHHLDDALSRLGVTGARPASH